MSVPREPGEAKPRSTGDIADRLSQDAADLVRQEVERLREAATSVIRRGGLGTAAVAGAGVCGVLALCSAHQSVLRALERTMSPQGAAAVLTAVYAAGAGALSVIGAGKLREAARASNNALRQTGDDLPFTHR